MAQERYIPEQEPNFDQDVEMRVRDEVERVRQEEYNAAVERAKARKLDQQRSNFREQFDQEIAETTTESATDLRQEANREAPSKLLIGLILLILLLFLLSLSGRLRLPGSSPSTAGSGAAANNAAGPLTPILGQSPELTTGNAGDITSQIGRGESAEGTRVLNTVAQIDPNISQLFAPYYLNHDGLRVFGKSISPLLTINGRQTQWFERTRLEYWPEYAGTTYEVQSALVGSEYTDQRTFPTQTFFTNRPGLRFFGETSHGVGGKFLDYWEAHGGLDTFGYPLSDEVIEVLPETKRYHTVQYFQRARFELHPEHVGTADEVQLGLLGRALYLNEAKSMPVPPVAPTPVPLP